MFNFTEILMGDYTNLYSIITTNIEETYLQLIVFTVGLFFYGFFVWHFYRTLSKRDLFKVDLEKYKLPTTKHRTLGKLWSVFTYILKYGVVFPVYIAVWLSILSIILIILSEEMMVNHIFLTSVVIVSATRIASYYKEELAVDLAKLIPFALLAVLIMDPNFFSLETTIERLSEIPNIWLQIIQFLIFSTILEWTLRILYLVKKATDRGREKAVSLAKQ